MPEYLNKSTAHIVIHDDTLPALKFPAIALIKVN